MVHVREDMTGWVMAEHGVLDSRLIVINQTNDYVSPNGKHYSKWLCKCNCGNPDYICVLGKYLKDGTTKSCGCLAIERLIERNSKRNQYFLDGTYGIGLAINTNNEFYFDLEDYDKIKDYCWNEHVSTAGYHALEAWDPKSQKRIRMHYLITNSYSDHEDRNPLNNRKNNLRIATKSENSQNSSIPKNNSSGVIGVHWHKKQQKWHAYIKIDYRRIHLGSFANKEDAIKARLQGELEYFQSGFEPQRHLFKEYGIIQEVQNDDCN